MEHGFFIAIVNDDRAPDDLLERIKKPLRLTRPQFEYLTYVLEGHGLCVVPDQDWAN
jgi:hypothetical protein